jgi:hypothetical protein
VPPPQQKEPGNEEESMTEAEKAMLAAKKRHEEEENAKMLDYEVRKCFALATETSNLKAIAIIISVPTQGRARAV